MPRIEQIWAWVWEQSSGDEDIVVMPVPGEGGVPLVGADRQAVEAFRWYAEGASKEHGLRCRLVLFTARVDKELF